MVNDTESLGIVLARPKHYTIRIFRSYGNR